MMNADDLALIASQHRGEWGRMKDPSTATVKGPDPRYPGSPELVDLPNPEPIWIITYRDGSSARVQEKVDAAGTPSGQYLPADAPSPGTERQAQLVTLAGGGQGILNPDGSVTAIQATIGPPKPPGGSWQGPVYWQLDENGVPQPRQINPLELQQQQETRDRQRLQDENTATYQQGRNQIDRARMLKEISDAEWKERTDEWDRWYKVNVEVPQTLRKEEDVLRGNALTYGQKAGENAVSDITAGLPYRYSPGFTERRGQALQAAAGGDYRAALRNPIAQGYRAPDLAGARASAETQAGRGYLGAFDFNPGAIASAIPYRGAPPVATGAQAAPAVMDDDEVIRNLARQFTG